MAILYGTTGDGTTLPVLVDQFGNLLAKGIEGPPGPPGSPGVGQLPPDPFEGAILGWEDGELSWLGGSVPLPAGTYGPYVYNSESASLDIPQDASSLVNGQQLYMSDVNGNEISAVFTTDPIENVIPLTSNGNWSAGYTVLNSNNNCSPVTSGYCPKKLFDSTQTSGYELGKGNNIVVDREYNVIYTNTFPAGTYVIDYGFNREGSIANMRNFSVYADGVKHVITTSPFPSTGVTGSFSWTQSTSFSELKFEAFGAGAGNCGIGLKKLEVDNTRIVDGTSLPIGETLIFPTATNFDKFEVGDVVQAGATIIAIDDTVPSISVDGGSWSAGDTSLKKYMSGTGSVLFGSVNTIVMRNNNNEWIDNYYVTAPEQRIAARKVASTAIKRKKK